MCPGGSRACFVGMLVYPAGFFGPRPVTHRSFLYPAAVLLLLATHALCADVDTGAGTTEPVKRLVERGIGEWRRGEQGGPAAGDHFETAARLLEQALSYAPDQPTASHALASVYMRTGDTESAAEVLLRALSMAPDSAMLRARLGYAYRYAGLLDRSIAEYRRSQRLDPAPDKQIKAERQIVKALIYSGRYDEAFGVYSTLLSRLRELGREPDEKMLFYQGLAHYYAGDIDTALAMFDASADTRPETLWSSFASAYRSAAIGDLPALRHLADELESGNVSDGERRYRLAHLNALAGRTGQALVHLEASARAGFFCFWYTQSDRLLAAIADSGEFTRILEYVRTRHEAFVAMSGERMFEP